MGRGDLLDAAERVVAVRVEEVDLAVVDASDTEEKVAGEAERHGSARVLDAIWV